MHQHPYNINQTKVVQSKFFICMFLYLCLLFSMAMHPTSCSLLETEPSPILYFVYSFIFRPHTHWFP